MLGAVAQFERDLIIERTKAALAMARKNGKRLGPPVKWETGMAKQARRLMAGGELNGPGSGERLGASMTSFWEAELLPF